MLPLLWSQSPYDTPHSLTIVFVKISLRHYQKECTRVLILVLKIMNTTTSLRLRNRRLPKTPRGLTSNK